MPAWPTHPTDVQSNVWIPTNSRPHTPSLSQQRSFYTGARFNFEGLQRRRTSLLSHHEGHTCNPKNIIIVFLISTKRQAYYLHRSAAVANPLSGEHFPSFYGHTAVLHVCSRRCTMFYFSGSKPIAWPKYCETCLRPRTRPTAPQLGDIIKRIVSLIMAEGGTEDLPSLQEPQLRPVDITPSGGWDNFYHWLCCVCVVTFDLELGQALEVG